MPKPKESVSKNGEVMHTTVGAVIKKDGKYLLIDRNLTPFGFGCVTGHVDEGEDPVTALYREVKEESGLTITKHTLLAEEENVQEVNCVYGLKLHHWLVFACEFSGEVKADPKEVKSIAWYTVEEMKQLKFEPSWVYWLKKLEIL